MKERWTVRWFRKRALLYHLLVLIIAPGCLYAGWWQIHRAEDGNTLSYLYSIEWPIFAILAVVGWWQLIHEDPAAVESRKVERARRAMMRGPFIPPPPEADSGFTHPLQPGSFGVLGTAGREGAEPGGLARRDATGTPGDGGMAGGEQVEVHALSSYNAYLAKLSAGGGRKSWRNPHGVAATARPDPAARLAPAETRGAVGGEPAPAAIPAPPAPAGPDHRPAWALPAETSRDDPA